MKYQIIGLGELLFDELPDGKRPGGAPANVAVIASGLGLKTALISAVGNDQSGNELIEKLQSFGVTTSLIARNTYPSGRVKVTLDHGIPSYEICLDSAWDHIPWTGQALDALNNCDAAVFGSLAQRSPESGSNIPKLLSESRARWKIFDMNLRQNFYSRELLQKSLEIADILKISDEELPQAAEALNLPQQPDFILSQLKTQYNLQEIIFTRGAKGSTIISANEVVETPAYTMGALADTVGAGDAFLAGYISGIINQLSIHFVQALRC